MTSSYPVEVSYLFLFKLSILSWKILLFKDNHESSMTRRAWNAISFGTKHATSVPLLPPCDLYARVCLFVCVCYVCFGVVCVSGTTCFVPEIGTVVLYQVASLPKYESLFVLKIRRTIQRHWRCSQAVDESQVLWCDRWWCVAIPQRVKRWVLVQVEYSSAADDAYQTMLFVSLRIIFSRTPCTIPAVTVPVTAVRQFRWNLRHTYQHARLTFYFLFFFLDKDKAYAAHFENDAPTWFGYLEKLVAASKTDFVWVMFPSKQTQHN